MQDPARPVVAGVRALRLTVTGWVSILHRVSGILLALSVPGLWIALAAALAGADGFDRVRAFFQSPPGGLLVLGLLWAGAHHLLAGLRHALIDRGRATSPLCARRMAWGVLVAAPVLALIVFIGGAL